MLSSCPVNSTKPCFQRLALPPQSGLLKPKPHKSHHVPAIILVEFSHSAGNGKVAAELQRPVQLIAGVPAALTYRNRKYSSCCPPLWRGCAGLCSHPGAAQLHGTGGRRSPSPPSRCVWGEMVLWNRCALQGQCSELSSRWLRTRSSEDAREGRCCLL